VVNRDFASFMSLYYPGNVTGASALRATAARAFMP
jgi:hypothetical protein